MFATLAIAAEKTTSSWSGLMRFLQRIGEFLLMIAPGVIVASFAMSALMWVCAGSSSKMAHRAKDQFKATCIVTVVIGGYWLLRGLVSTLAVGDFG